MLEVRVLAAFELATEFLVPDSVFGLSSAIVIIVLSVRSSSSIKNKL